MQLPPLTFTVLDTETTGFIPGVNRVIEFASMYVKNGIIQNEFECLCSIPVTIPKEVTILTRIFDETIKDQPSFADQAATILDHIGPNTIIVGQNIQYDIRMLKGEGIDLSSRLTLDTSMLASLVFPELASYSLPYMSQVLQLNHTPVHRALGDVRATTELFSKCFERLQSISLPMYESLQQLLPRLTPAYQQLFACIETPSSTMPPVWCTVAPKVAVKPVETVAVTVPESEAVQILTEPVSPSALPSLIAALQLQPTNQYIIAVKNSRMVEAELSALGVQVLELASSVLHQAAARSFVEQTHFTDDESLLAIKLLWYTPRFLKDLPIHGGEKDIWYARLACNEQSPEYLDALRINSHILLCNHWQLLSAVDQFSSSSFLHSVQHPKIFIDDATSLEDTASKAFGIECDCHMLRTAAQAFPSALQFTDVFQLWLERLRSDQMSMYITAAHVNAADAIELRRQLQTLLEDSTVPDSLRTLLQKIHTILDASQLSERITWLEVGQDDRQVLHAVPVSVASLLEAKLYDRFPVTLLLPTTNVHEYQEIIPVHTQVTSVSWQVPVNLTIDLKPSVSMNQIFLDPPAGKTVVLVAGRKRIEDIFIAHTVALEEKGVTLLCQGFSGGMSRMQAEFAALQTDAIMVLTGFQFETIDLPPDTIHVLCIESIPFDHPHHMVVSKRSEKYSSSFMQYALPRTMQRLYRIMRTFARSAKPDAIAYIFDDRLHTKQYGALLGDYIQSFFTLAESSHAEPSSNPVQPTLF